MLEIKIQWINYEREESPVNFLKQENKDQEWSRLIKKIWSQLTAPKH